MLFTLAALTFILAAFDCWLSRRRILTYGLFVEQNKVITTLIAYTGVEVGILLGIMVPTACLTFLLLMTHFEVGFALLLGFRAKLFITQLQSMIFEKQVRDLKNKLDSQGVAIQKPTLPSDSSESVTPLDSKDDNARKS